MKNSGGGTPRKNRHVTAALGGGHIWVCLAVFPRGSSAFSTGGGASLRGDGGRGHFRKGSLQTLGIREDGSPGTGVSQWALLLFLCVKSLG